jgi:hypothetical protein
MTVQPACVCAPALRSGTDGGIVVTTCQRFLSGHGPVRLGLMLKLPLHLPDAVRLVVLHSTAGAKALVHAVCFALTELCNGSSRHA